MEGDSCMRACDVMSTPVISVRPHQFVSDVLLIFRKHRIGGVPVVSHEGKLVGIMTDGDIIRFIRDDAPFYVDVLLGVLARYDKEGPEDRVLHFLSIPVAKLMTRKVIAVSADTSLSEVVKILSERQIKKVPVVDQGRVVGLISRGDVIRILVDKVLERRETTYVDHS
jgi:CBS domain-containing protein